MHTALDMHSPLLQLGGLQLAKKPIEVGSCMPGRHPDELASPPFKPYA